MQIAFTNSMQNKNHLNTKLSNVQISGAVHYNKPDKKNGIVMSNGKANIAASVELSQSGRYKARMLKESEQSQTNDVMDKAESTINDIIDTVKNGGKLSKDQERIFQEEMKKMASKHYSDMKDMKLKPTDVLQELKENFLQRQQIFADMQKKVESEMSDEQDLSDNVKLMTVQQENDEQKKLIEILKESLDDGEEDSDQDGNKKVDENSNQGSYDVTTGDENTDSTESVDDGSLSDRLRAADLIDKNTKQISDMKAQSANEGKKERLYAKNLDHDYEQIMDVLNHDELGADEKLEAYEDYKINSYNNAYHREVYRNKKVFDLETWLMGKIQFNSNNDIHEVKNDGPDRSRIGTDFIKKFMI